MKKKIRLGFIGGGHNSLIGILHKVSAYMHDRYEIVGGVSILNMRIVLSLLDKLVLVKIEYIKM